MRQTRGTSGPKKVQSNKEHSPISAAAGKAKSADMSPTSEADDADPQMVGSSRKRKRGNKKSSSEPALNFDQFPPAMQKKLMKQALKAYAQMTNADAGMYVFLIHTKAEVILYRNSTN
jgi:hypothetical protein